MLCPNCGFPLDQRNLPPACPKCEEELVRAMASKPLEPLVSGDERLLLLRSVAQPSAPVRFQDHFIHIRLVRHV